MSIPIENDEVRLERARRLIGWAPLLVAIILAVLWVAGAPDATPDLRFSAPLVARPGTSVGLRAWHLASDREGHTVVGAPEVTVELRNAAGLAVDSVVLRPSRVHGVEGALPIPRAADERMSLVALATIEGEDVVARRTLYVRDGIDSRLPAGRTVNEFQIYELGPARVRDAARAPSTLDPRVEEGACVPDLPCHLLVWVGDWQGVVRARGLTGVDDVSPTMQVDSGFARIPLVVRGQEGRVAVEALGRDGAVLAVREVRIPLVPGGLVGRATEDDGRLRLDWQSLDDARAVLVDVFEDRRWVRALSVDRERPWVDLSPRGLVRIQLRSDLFSDNTAAVVHVAYAEPGSALEAAADAVLGAAAEEGLDPLAMAVRDGDFVGDPSVAVRALLAIPAFDVVAVGTGMKADAAAEQATRRAQDGRRWVAAGAILGIGFAVSFVLLRLERIASARAARILEAFGDDASPTASRASPGRGLWAFVLFVFVVLAVVALSKRWF